MVLTAGNYCGGLHVEVLESPSTLPDIVNGLTGARAMASIMAEHQPEKSGSLNRFVEGL